MNDKNFTYEILKEECVGDSLAKHNFNFLSLDSVLCNLSSLFFTETNQNTPLFSVFYDLSTNKKIYNDNLPQMLNPYRFDRTHSAISLLSSYWMKQELTVEYEYNKSNKNNLVQDFFLNTDNATFISELTSRGLDYIEQKFVNSKFNNNAKINVIVPIYENDGKIIKTFGYDIYDSVNTVVREITSVDLPIYENIKSSIPKEEYRKINGYYRKEDSSFGIVPIISYINKNNDWTFVEILSTKCPPTRKINVIENEFVQNSGSFNTQTKQISLGTCSPILFNQWYSRDVYGSAVAFANGSENNYGTLSVTFEKSPTEYITYTWTASDNQYVDTYLEWNDGNIFASNASPNTKKVFRTWVMPYQNTKNIRFMFKKDTKAQNYSLCASKRIFAT
jgi:hypothetical protein